MNSLNIIDISNNLGDAKSLITHPASSTHANIEAKERAKLGITDSLVRLSVGIENADDLLGDIKHRL
jgi:O-succinylhomoserine sulfhydrylase